MAFIPALYSQRDIRWSWRKLGTSGLTMGGFGCTTTVAARFCSWVMGRNVTPGELCAWLKKNNGYNGYGEILWKKVEEFTKFHLMYKGRGTEPPKPDITYAMRIVQWGKLKHFVGRMPNEMCYDPWDGKVKPIHQQKWIPLNEYRYFKKV